MEELGERNMGELGAEPPFRMGWSGKASGPRRHFKQNLETERCKEVLPQNMLLWGSGYFEMWPLKNTKCREMLSLNSPHPPKDRFFERNPTVMDFDQPGRTDCHWRD